MEFDLILYGMVGVAFFVGTTSMFRWIRSGFRAMNVLERRISQTRHQSKLKAHLQRILREVNDATESSGRIDIYEGYEESSTLIVVTVQIDDADGRSRVISMPFEKMEPLLDELLLALREMDADERKHVLPALQQDSPQGRVNYILKVLNEANIMENLSAKILPYRTVLPGLSRRLSF